MTPPQFSQSKKKILEEIDSNQRWGTVRFLLKINPQYRQEITSELNNYGQVDYHQFPWARHLQVKTENYQQAVDLVDRLYSDQGLEGVLNIGVDSKTVALHSSYSRKIIK